MSFSPIIGNEQDARSPFDLTVSNQWKMNGRRITGGKRVVGSGLFTQGWMLRWGMSDVILPKDWLLADIGELCDLINGRAFKPTDWGEVGLPIIRIQNLNDKKKPL